ncbi:MAG: tripartite tricarboxylate transporter substrate-binding protein [Pseudomonadota bacterium]
MTRRAALLGLGLTGLLGAGLLASRPLAAEEDYPARPVHVIVSYGPGGAIDVATRIVAERMAVALGKPVLVENRPGAGSTIAADYVARSTPDGYNLLVTGTAHTVVAELYPQAPFDPVRDFQPISHLGTMPFVLAVNPGLPTPDFASFVGYLKAHPGEVNFGSAGPGSSSDLGVLLFAKMTGLEFVRVPYRSTPAAMTDLVAGQIGFMLDSQNVLAPQVRSGALRGLAVSSLVRSPQLPELKTLDELGLAGFDASSWQAMLAPARTPRPIIDKLAAAVATALADPGVQKRYLELGYLVPSRIGPEAATRVSGARNRQMGTARQGVRRRRRLTVPRARPIRSTMIPARTKSVAPSPLSQAQIDAFRRDGFYAPVDAIGVDDARRLRGELEAFERTLPPGPIPARDRRKLHVRLPGCASWSRIRAFSTSWSCCSAPTSWCSPAPSSSRTRIPTRSRPGIRTRPISASPPMSMSRPGWRCRRPRSSPAAWSSSRAAICWASCATAPTSCRAASTPAPRRSASRSIRGAPHSGRCSRVNCRCTTRWWCMIRRPITAPTAVSASASATSRRGCATAAASAPARSWCAAPTTEISTASPIRAR